MSGLLGTLFESNKEPAFAAHKMCQALSGFALFATAPYLCTNVKIFVVISVLLLAMSGYIALEVLLRVRSLKDHQPTVEELVVTSENAEEGKDEAKMQSN